MWRLLELVSDLERRIGALYARFAERFRDLPPVAAYWREMAAEEEIHSLIVAAAREVFPPATPAPRGNWARTLGEIEALIRTTSAEAGAGLSLEDALEKAELLEKSELNAITDLIIRHAGRGFSRLAPLVAESRVDAHLDKVVRARERFCAQGPGVRE